MKANCISNWTLLVRKDRLGKEIRFAENYKFNEDYWFLCRLTEKCDIIFLDTVTAENRVHNDPRLTQIGYIEIFKTHIDLCNKIYRSSNSAYRPSDEEIDRTCKRLNIMLFKKYLKDGMRPEARRTYDAIRKIPGPGEDAAYFFYWLTLWFPFNIVKNLIAVKALLRKKWSQIHH